jgi:glycosyltransferase involved in cell wall biosynthesis
MIRMTGDDRHGGADGSIITRSACLLSLVIPMHDEQQNVEPLLARLLPVLDRLCTPAEILCVDDGSQDGTLATLKEYRAGEQRLKIIRLSRNFGKEVALAAGLEHASGDAVVMMDADLQHPPELIEAFVERWRAGYEMVYGVRRLWVGRSRRRTLASRLFYRLFSILANSDLPRGAGDFRLLDRRVVDALNACTERSRFNNGLYAWLGFRHVGIPFDVDGRANGRSGWSIFALWRFAIDAVTSFSTIPLRIWSYLGVLVSVFALSYGAFIVLHTLIFGKDVPGYPSLFAAITFFSGVQLISLGVLGEYLGRVFVEVKRRPLFVVADTEGFEPERPHRRRAGDEIIPEGERAPLFSLRDGRSTMAAQARPVGDG